MTRFRSQSAYAPQHRHSFIYTERKNGSVIIGPCEFCGIFPANELSNQGWVIVLDSQPDDESKEVSA